MFNHGFHPFHLVTFSPWPLLSSISLFCFVMCMFFYMMSKCSFTLTVLCVFSLILTIGQWFRDIVREGTYMGCHGYNVCSGLYLGILMFIVSEVMFFFSFFFGYYFISLSPDIELGMGWPPMGVVPLSFYQVPLLNTMLLLSSGVCITWSHYSLLDSNYHQCVIGLCLTVMCGLLFTYFQFVEYFDCSFCMSDSVYGSLFFISTGFHGLHVIIGSCFIIVSLFRVYFNQMSSKHHLGFEAASWYWHFVDVVWLFLFVSIYWLGS